MSVRGQDPLEQRLLILAPTSRDATLTVEILADAQIAGHICRDVAEAIREMEHGAAGLLISEESFLPGGLLQLAEGLNRQPPWSDFPLIVLTRQGADSIATAEAVRRLGNVTLLERPVRVMTLLSAAKMALRARNHQYDLRIQLETISRNERNLIDLFENAAVGLHFVNADDVIIRANQTELKLLGYAEDEYVGRHVTEFHADRAVIGEMLRRLHAGETIESQEVVLRAKDGSVRHVLISANVLWEDGKFVHTRCFTRDITLRKIAEEALRDADRRKDEFLATLAHELRNPLAPIRNGLHILRLSNDGNPANERICEMIDRQVNHMVRLVDDLMEVSRITRGKIELKRERIEVAAVIQAAVETSRPFLEAAGHQLAISIPAEPMILDGDFVRLTQVLGNLLNNAAKYTEIAGQVWLTVRKSNDEVVISVRDTGIGIEAEMLSHVFDMFTQLNHAPNRPQGGLGIGLALVKSLVELHQGRVEARSAGLGQGSEFFVSLPLAMTLNPASAKPSTIVPRALSSQRVLVVDDNRDAADSLGTLLRFLGAEVRVAYDGPSALEIIRNDNPAVVLLDLGMPGMDGYEVVRRIHQDPDFDRIKVVALTGWGQEEDRRQVMAAGFDHHLVKPADLGALQSLLLSLAQA